MEDWRTLKTGEMQVKRPIYAEAVIFDFDGTLVDSITQHYEVTMAIARRLGGSACDFASYRRLFQHDTQFTLYRTLGAQADEETITKMYISSWPSYARSVTPMPEVYETLEALWRKGIVLGIVSGSQQNAVRASLENFGLARFFNSAYVYGSGKATLIDKEAAFADLQRTWRIPARFITAVGDMPFEIRAARKHNMRAIGFLGGLGTRAMLGEAGAERCVRKLSVLMKVLRGRYDATYKPR